MDNIIIPPILGWLIGGAGGLGILIAGAGYGYGQFKRGQRESDEGTIGSLQRQLDTFKGELAEVKKENKELVAINNQLQGKLETYKEIALGQDPEMREIMKTLAKTVPVLSQNILYCQKHNETVTKK